MNSPHAFDPLAAAYDSDFTHTAIGRYLRRRVHARLQSLFRAGDQVLELGCGTGEDALWLAERGVSVLATDASDAMLDMTRAKTAGNARVRVDKLDLRQLPASGYLPPITSSDNSTWLFDGAVANFGPLNCLHDWRSLAVWLAQRVRPGGVAAFGVMSPLCLWEMAWHGAHGDLKTAFRRRRQGSAFQPLFSRGEHSSAQAIHIHYPTVRRLSRDFAPYFQRTYVEPLGLFLPPSDVYGAVEKRQRLFSLLLYLEERFGKSRMLAPLADHYWIEFARV